MSKFKVGDWVRKVASGHLWEFKVGDELTVTGFSSLGNAWVSNGEDTDTAHDSDLELISRPSETPPTTIEHEGYTYTRGERVLPDWLKDGAWVVNVGTGDLRQVHEVSPGVFNLATGTAISIRYGEHIRDQYRPHEPSDYKWGDWAMYEGKKIFVMAKIKPDGRLAASYPNMDGRCEHTGTSQWGYIHTSQLTPTHAP